MLIATICLVGVTGLGMAGAFLKSVFHFGKQAGKLTDSIDRLTTAVDNMGNKLADHEIRIIKLEAK